MDEALLSGILDVDEYVAKLIKQVDEYENRAVLETKLKERDAFLKKLETYLREENRIHTIHACFAKWRHFTLLRKLNRTNQDLAIAQTEIDAVKAQNVLLNRQKRELQGRLGEQNDKKLHGVDVSELAAQVKELVEQLEKEKAEKALLIAKLEDFSGKEDGGVRTRRKTALSESTNHNIKQGDNVGKVVRDYQVKIQRLEDELSNERLKKANEIAKRLEKESEVVRQRREVEDAKAELVSLQLKLARIEAGSGAFSRQAGDIPRQANLKSTEEELFNNHIPEYHELTESKTLVSNAPRKSFFKSSNSSSLATSANVPKKPALSALVENIEPNAGESDGCAQQ